MPTSERRSERFQRTFQILSVNSQVLIYSFQLDIYLSPTPGF